MRYALSVVSCQLSAPCRPGRKAAGNPACPGGGGACIVSLEWRIRSVRQQGPGQAGLPVLHLSSQKGTDSLGNAVCSGLRGEGLAVRTGSLLLECRGFSRDASCGGSLSLRDVEDRQSCLSGWGVGGAFIVSSNGESVASGKRDPDRQDCLSSTCRRKSERTAVVMLSVRGRSPSGVPGVLTRCELRSVVGCQLSAPCRPSEKLQTTDN